MRRFLLLFSLWLLGHTIAMAQVRSVSGKVTDASGNPVPFASVKILNTQSGVNADENGNFVISAKPGDKLIITSVDFESKTVTVPGNGALRVSINKADKSLSEVVVTTALGVKRQARELGYATAQIKAAQLTQAAVTNTATGLAAKISGVDIRLADNGVNPQVKVTFRGSRSIEGNNAALVVVDGVPVDQSYLANLNPSDIEDVTVLKGANAAALYGMAASNGVMIMSTKKGKESSPSIMAIRSVGNRSPISRNYSLSIADMAAKAPVRIMTLPITTARIIS